MANPAIDTARDEEVLTAFLSEIEGNEPVDQFFPATRVLDKLIAAAKMKDGGWQSMIPMATGENSTIKDFSGFDEFDTTQQDLVTMLVYAFKQKGGSVVMPWDQMREIAGNNHAVYDRVKFLRNNFIKSLLNKLEIDLFAIAASESADQIFSLNTIIDDTAGTAPGEKTVSEEPEWSSTVITGGSFDTQGLDDMRTLISCIDEDGAEVDTIVTNKAVYNFYEKKIDPDVRYSSAQGTGGRGFKSLEFNMIPLCYAKNVGAANNTIYMWDSKNLWLDIDTDANFVLDPFEKPTNQKAFVSLGYARTKTVCDRRKSTGRINSIVA